MAGLDLSRVHVYARHRDPSTGEVDQRLVEFNPVLRLKSGSAPPIYIQQGVAYSEGGEPLHELPEWFDKELVKCSADTLQAVGWRGDNDAASLPPPPHESPAAPGPLTPRGALLERLEELSDSALEALLNASTQGTPATPISELDPDRFPADPEPEEEEVPVAALLPPIPPAEVVIPKKRWTCDECGEEMELRLKGSHISRHRTWERQQAKRSQALSSTAS